MEITIVKSLTVLVENPGQHTDLNKGGLLKGMESSRQNTGK